MKIIRLAVSTDQLDERVTNLKERHQELKSEFRDLKDKVKKISDTMDDLNIGQRRFWQAQTVFTSLQRKIERFEKIESEWRNYKKVMEDDLKQLIEKRVKAQIGTIGNIGQG